MQLFGPKNSDFHRDFLVIVLILWVELFGGSGGRCDPACLPFRLKSRDFGFV